MEFGIFKVGGIYILMFNPWADWSPSVQREVHACYYWNTVNYFIESIVRLYAKEG
jgi:hypothetical protein